MTIVLEPEARAATGSGAETTALTVALVGNPNCGKTALFNALTGGRAKVANYAGVTVERRSGRLVMPSGRPLQVIDLPGTYSLRARSPDEAVTRDAVLGVLEGEPSPDVIVCVADATNLLLVLRLVLELKTTGRPMLLALNMIDIAERQGLVIDQVGLEAALGVPVLAIVATRRRGIDDLAAAIERIGLSRDPEGSQWREPSAAEVRSLHQRAERLHRAYVRPPAFPDTLTGRLDRVLLHPVYGLAILMGLMFVMFQAVFAWAAPIQDLIEAAFAALAALAGQAIPEGLLRSFVTDGLISGVGSVLVFLPQIMVLFLFIILLEDTGYMARAAFLMDRLMGGAGLHGRAFIPLLSSFACAIPGIMATRVIDNRRDRLTTMLVAPLMTCSARLPVYTLIIGAFIPARAVAGFVSLQGLVMFGLYAVGVGSALAVAFALRRLAWRSASEPFLMALPSYKAPDWKNVAVGVWQRAEVFLRRAGTIILVVMVAIWALASAPPPPVGATGPAIDYSFAGMIGKLLEPLLRPIGFNWQMSMALVPGLAAREVAVAALGTVYAIGDGQPGQLAGQLSSHWSLASALSFLAWYVFAPQCMSTLAVLRRETNSWRWPLFAFAYLTALAYLAAFLTYQGFRLIGWG